MTKSSVEGEEGGPDRGGLKKEEKIKDSLSEEKSLELDFRVVKIDVWKKER